MRTLKATVYAEQPGNLATTVLTAGLTENEVREIAPWAFDEGVMGDHVWEDDADSSTTEKFPSLDGLNKTELTQIAQDEGVELEENDNKAAITEKIEQHRNS